MGATDPFKPAATAEPASRKAPGVPAPGDGGRVAAKGPSRGETPALGWRDWITTVGLLLALAALAAGIALAAPKPGPKPKSKIQLDLDHPRSLAKFRLLERGGATVTEADLAGQILVVDFVFTSCSSTCRVVNDRMEKIQELTRGKQNVRLVSLTVDPRTDTPAVLSRFADQYRADPVRWLFLTGAKADVHKLIETSFIPAYSDFAEFFPGGFIATYRIMVVDGRGRVVSAFDGTSDQAPRAILDEIDRLQGNHAN